MPTNKEMVEALLDADDLLKIVYADYASSERCKSIREVIAAMGELGSDDLGHRDGSTPSSSASDYKEFDDLFLEEVVDGQKMQHHIDFNQGVKAAIAAMGDASARKDEDADANVLETSPASDCPKSTVDKDNCPKQGDSLASDSKFSRNYDDSNKLALREKSVAEEIRCKILDISELTDVFDQEDADGNYLIITKIFNAIKPYLRTTDHPHNEDKIIGIIVDELSAGISNKWGKAKRILNRMRPYLRTTEQVSVSVEKCVKAMDQVAHETFSGYIEYEPHDFAKAVLDAAGVTYGE